MLLDEILLVVEKIQNLAVKADKQDKFLAKSKGNDKILVFDKYNFDEKIETILKQK